MPIGKNAIKRVSSSNAAPSVENTVVEEPKVEVVPVVEAPVEAPIVEAPKKKTTKKAAPKKSMETEPDLSPVNTAKKVTKKPSKKETADDFNHISLGDDLPYYLL